MFAAVIAAALLQFTPHDADTALATAAALVERHTPRDAGSDPRFSAARFIRDSAAAAGAASAKLDVFTATALGVPRRFANVVAEFRRDPAAPWIVLVSHYDTKPGVACPGANDGASTTGLLVAFCGVIARSAPLPVSVMLVWTDGEECVSAYGVDDGLWGSRHAAGWLAASGRSVRAVICADMLGDASLDISVPRNTSCELRALALSAAGRIGLADRVAEIPELVKDDHVPFLQKGFPAVDLIDFHYGGAPGKNDWWHTPADTPDKLSSASLLASGRLVCEMIDGLAGEKEP